MEGHYGVHVDLTSRIELISVAIMYLLSAIRLPFDLSNTRDNMLNEDCGRSILTQDRPIRCQDSSLIPAASRPARSRAPIANTSSFLLTQKDISNSHKAQTQPRNTEQRSLAGP